MTDHMKAAIKAAAKALTEIGLYNNEEGLDGPFGGTFIEGPFNIVIPTILPAAEPHIRAMIAEEIMDYWDACGELIDTHNGARLAFDAIAHQIAKGPQQ